MKFAVVIFPGSSGDRDLGYAVAQNTGAEVDYVWHTETDLSAYDAILLPGGSSYGNYLRAGALASVTPIMQAVSTEAQKGKLILGIANGFQVLLEAHLLPGAMLVNESQKFLSTTVHMSVVNNTTPFTGDYQANETLQMPLANDYIRYYCDQDTLAKLKQNGQIVFRYLNDKTGSLAGIAGISNQAGNILGMMPQPERATESLLGSKSGIKLFKSMLKRGRDSHVTI